MFISDVAFMLRYKFARIVICTAWEHIIPLNLTQVLIIAKVLTVLFSSPRVFIFSSGDI